MEIKYVEGSHITSNNTNTGTQVIYGISEFLNNANANAVPTSIKLNFTDLIGRGTQRGQRIGNKIFLRHIRIKGGVWAGTSAVAANEQYVKMIIVRVKQAQGNPNSLVSIIPFADNYTQPISRSGGTSVGDGKGWGTSGGGDIKAAIMADFTNEWKYLYSRWGNDFQILKRKVWKVSKETGVNAEKKLFKMNIKIFKPAFWDDNDNPQDGQIYLYYWCDNPCEDPALPVASITGQTRPTLGMTYRLSFTDV